MCEQVGLITGRELNLCKYLLDLICSMNEVQKNEIVLNVNVIHLFAVFGQIKVDVCKIKSYSLWPRY